MSDQNNDDSFAAIRLEQLSLATALLSLNDEAEWSIVWQNPSAQSLWQDYDLNLDLELKLLLLDAHSRKTPCSFLHKTHHSLERYRFIATPMSSDKQMQLLLQFFPDGSNHIADSVGQDDEIYRLILDASQAGVMDYDLLYNRIQYTDKTYQVLDISHVDLGHSFEDFLARVHPLDSEAVSDSFEMHLTAHWPFHIKFRYRTSSGSYIWVQMIGRAMWNDQDKPIRFIGSMQNISDQIFAKEQIQQKENLIEQIIDSLPISIYVKDERGIYRFFSRQTEQETGVERGQAIGKTDYEVFPIHLARKQAIQDKLAKEEGKLVISEEEIVEPGGQRWLLMGRGPITIKTGYAETKWVLGFSLDISHQKAVEQMLRLAKEDAEKATRAKSEFLSVMSHEIRTPLNSVIGSAQLILDTDLEPEQKQHIEMIQRSGEHLLHLINDILDYNKLEAQKMQLEAAPFDLQQQINTVLQINQSNAALKGVVLIKEIDSQVHSHYIGDQARLRQILLNLVGNAVKFTEEGRVALNVKWLSTTEQNDLLRFEIQDSGIGIAKENIGKLFSEFTQADSSTTRKFGGTGLGLAICKKLVEAMKGQIGVESVFGEGATFWFEIPLQQVDLSEIQVHEEESLPELDRTLNILVAEDNPPNQLLIKAILTKLEHDVTLVNNGLKALEKMQSDEHFDLVLMDMQMPEMDGLSSTREIRALGTEKANIPIIALTANALSGDRELVLEAGMNDYLTKPIDIKALKRALTIWGNAQWHDL